MRRDRSQQGFTLIELLVAMSIGLIIVNVAFTALYFTRKFVRKGEAIGSKNDVVQSMMLWCLGKVGTATYPTGPQFRLMGGAFNGTVTISGKPFNIAEIRLFASPTDATGTVVGTVYLPAPP